MENMTLRQLCETYGVSRRAVQGYEKAGLVKASARNERGHLLYNEGGQKRIKQIKQYQQLGFTIKEIKWLIVAPDIDVKKALENRIEQLKEKQIQLNHVIEKACEMIDDI